MFWREKEIFKAPCNILRIFLKVQFYFASSMNLSYPQHTYEFLFLLHSLCLLCQ